MVLTAVATVPETIRKNAAGAHGIVPVVGRALCVLPVPTPDDMPEDRAVVGAAYSILRLHVGASAILGSMGRVAAALADVSAPLAALQSVAAVAALDGPADLLDEAAQYVARCLGPGGRWGPVHVAMALAVIHGYRTRGELEEARGVAAAASAVLSAVDAQALRREFGDELQALAAGLSDQLPAEIGAGRPNGLREGPGGSAWMLRFEGVQFAVPNVKGLRYIRALICRAQGRGGRRMLAWELFEQVEGTPRPEPPSAQHDRHAVADFALDPVGRAKARDGRRDRRGSPSDPAREKPRKAITNAIATAIRTIRVESAEAAAAIDAAIERGNTFAWTADPGEWDV